MAGRSGRLIDERGGRALREAAAFLAALAGVAGATVAIYGGLAVDPTRRGASVGLVVALAGTVGAVVLGRRGTNVVRWLGLAAALVLLVLPLLPVTDRGFFHWLDPERMALWPWLLLLAWPLSRWVLAGSWRGPCVLGAIQLGMLALFWEQTGGRVLTRDDFPAFLYRFHLLHEMFPMLTFWNPEWNGGYRATELVETGATSFYLLSWPISWLASPERAFALAVPWVFVFVLPWSTVLALRLLGVGMAGATLGGLLGLAPTVGLFLHMLTYGLPPFVITTMVAVTAVAAFAHLFLEGGRSWVVVGVLVASTALALAWPLGGLILAPVLPFAAFAATRLDADGWRRAGVSVAGIAALTLPWLVQNLRDGTSISHASAQASPIATVGLDRAEVVGTALRLVVELNPLAVVLGPVGLALLLASRRRRATGLVFGAVTAWCLLVGLVGDQVKHDIALERFVMPFSTLATALGAYALARIVEARETVGRAVVATVLVAAALLGARTAALHWDNRGLYVYTPMPEDLSRGLAGIRRACPRDQRVLVPGFSLHWFGGGHVAALPLLAKRSFVANDYYHRRYYADVVPPAYRSGEAFREFLELWDAGCVVGWNEGWNEALDRHPSLRLVHDEQWLRVYRTDVAANRFAEGTGSIRESIGGFVVETTDPEVVVKVRWVEGLRATEPARLSRVPVYDDVAFVRIEPRGLERIEVTW